MIAGQDPATTVATGVMFGRLKEKPPEPGTPRTSFFSRKRRSNA